MNSTDLLKKHLTEEELEFILYILKETKGTIVSITDIGEQHDRSVEERREKNRKVFWSRKKSSLREQFEAHRKRQSSSQDLHRNKI